MAATVRYSIPVQGWLFLCQIGCSDTVFALYDMVLEDMVFGSLDYPITNTEYGLPICGQIPALDFQETRSLHI